MPPAAGVREEFIGEATWHGDLERAEALLAAHPALRSGDIHLAAIQGDDDAVRRFIAEDRDSVTRRSRPYGADALNLLGLSKYLRLDPARSDAFVRAATALLDAGADPNTGFWTRGEYPEYETALYGAAGVAHHAPLTRLLVDRDADPNDGEAVYHSPETRENGAMKVLVESGRLKVQNLVTMLVRKHDWHDYEGVKYLLEHGANPSGASHWDFTPLRHAIARDNSLAILELLLDHGADPTRAHNGESDIAFAARRGRGDLLQVFERRGFDIRLPGVLNLIAACARGDRSAVKAIAKAEPALVKKLLAEGADLLARFTITTNDDGVRLLLDLGVPAGSLFAGDGYFGIAKDSTVLHIAAWGISTDLVRLFIARGVDVNAKDGKGRTALSLTVKACVDSYWTERRTPEPAKLLLEAGATLDGAGYPSGYADLDAVLGKYRT